MLLLLLLLAMATADQTFHSLFITFISSINFHFETHLGRLKDLKTINDTIEKLMCAFELLVPSCVCQCRRFIYLLELCSRNEEPPLYTVLTVRHFQSE